MHRRYEGPKATAVARIAVPKGFISMVVVAFETRERHERPTSATVSGFEATRGLIRVTSPSKRDEDSFEDRHPQGFILMAVVILQTRENMSVKNR